MQDQHPTSEASAGSIDQVVRRAVALSIRQPWAWLIIHAAKDIENRTWATRFRGRCLIHASKAMTRNEYTEAFDFYDEIETTGRVEIPSFDEVKRLCGGIVGAMLIGNCVRGSDSPWFCGPWGFVIDSAMSLPFQPCRGALGFFDASTPNDQISGANNATNL